MWILATDGDLFEGKRFWLRPGKTHIIGRTAPVSSLTIANKTVSRQHLRIDVENVGPKDCANLNTRSKIILEDLNTKIGTLVNGEQIRGQKYELKSEENVVAIGRYEFRFMFTWVPITFSCSVSKKNLPELYETLGPLDIKVLFPYERGVTTHLVVAKRNTAKGLQALVDGRYIVDHDTWLKAVVSAANLPDVPLEDDPEDEENAIPSPPAKSPLEADWDANFPDPLQYLPPRGEEPTNRDASAYAPNPERKNMFEGYTFVFCNKGQFTTLLPPITEGGGKALLREVIAHETEVNDFVKYVKEVAGEKGLGSFEDGSEGKGVVLVRYNPGKGSDSQQPDMDFFKEFNKRVSLFLDHRLIEQNEFLDAILGVDASVLRRPLEVESFNVMAPPPTTQTAMASQALQSSQQGPSSTAATTATRKASRFRKVAAAPVFKGFDSDDDNDTSILNSIPESMSVDRNPVEESQSQGLFVTQDPDWDPIRNIPDPSTIQTRSSRKRNTPPVDYDFDIEEDDIMDKVAPASTALKKRKLAEESERRRRGESTPPPQPPASKTVKEIAMKKTVKPEPRSIKKPKKQIDVAEVARERMEKAEKLARINRGLEDENMDGIDPEEIRKLTIIEPMELRRPPPLVRATRADEGERWDDAWNGRKNFKKFRRRGGDDAGRPAHRVIVPLQEHKKKVYGIGEHYWLDSSASRKKKGTGRDTLDISQVESQATSRSQPKSRGRTVEEPEVVEEVSGQPPDEDDSSDEEVVQPTIQRRGQRKNVAQTAPATKKRAAATTLTKPAPNKRAKQVVDDSESSEDDLKFRFGRRR